MLNSDSGNPAAYGRSSGLRSRVLIACAILWIVLGTLPVFCMWPPFPTQEFFGQSPALQFFGWILLSALVAAAICLFAWFDPEKGSTRMLRYSGFAILAGLLTALHYRITDLPNGNWQLDRYIDVLRLNDPPPDQYRYLTNGNFILSYLAFRFLFTFLLCNSTYLFARLYLTPRQAAIIPLVYAAYYPLSIWYYCGNLLDPLIHSVMLASLICCHRRRFWPFFWLFVVGMFIKETMLVFAPCWYLMNLETFGRRNREAVKDVLLLAGVGLFAFFGLRIPLNFCFTFMSLNRTHEFMIFSNLGLPWGHETNPASVFQRYLHPFLFVLMWLPLLIWKRRLLPPSQFWTTFYVAIAIYFVNMLFSWAHESRNFIPALVLLMVSAVSIFNSSRIAKPAQSPTLQSTS